MSALSELIASKLSGSGGGGGGSVTPESVVAATGQMTEAQTDRMRANIVAAQDALRLTATPTAGPSETTLMSGTWSGATWEEVRRAVLANRLIQVDVTGMGPVTLVYNAFPETSVDSVCFSFESEDTVVIARVALYSNSNFTVYLIARADPDVVTVGGSTPTIIPEANTIYECGELTSLTITNPPATGAYSIVFTSGATATTTTIPATILGLEDFAAEANTLYEINVLDNRAVVGSWAVSA